MNDPHFRYRHARTSGAYSTCWYCDHQLGDGRRFCDKGCAEAFEEDELAVERRVLARDRELSTASV
ncbi:hypothetical protein [Noviherbaspirillum sedimenti]|uniref:hypothetical protein n=1 Tax=Noviherbaspirillum sedimenti TaxID=2320865 RepID=UPI0011C4365D|nr:hypothetical protein [Noviherbaspirillum sedimenti]